MRAIKFKVFNTRLKKMSEPFAIEDLLSCEVALLHDSSIADEIIWIEYTGLQDKNGKEIYEGDIVECKVMPDRNLDYWGHKPPRYIISWGESGFIFDYYGNWWGVPSSTQDWEVIGNIYESKELLK